MFSSTIENLFDEPANLELFPPNAYIHLLYAVRISLFHTSMPFIDITCVCQKVCYNDKPFALM